jgi:hypothetical protein
VTEIQAPSETPLTETEIRRIVRQEMRTVFKYLRTSSELEAAVPRLGYPVMNAVLNAIENAARYNSP